MSDRQFERALTDWLEDGPTGPRCARSMASSSRSRRPPRNGISGSRGGSRCPYSLASALAVAIVAVVGAGGLLFLSNRDQGVATQPTAPASAVPTATASPSASASPHRP